jgi:hypothetical protein
MGINGILLEMSINHGSGTAFTTFYPDEITTLVDC